MNAFANDIIFHPSTSLYQIIKHRTISIFIIIAKTMGLKAMYIYFVDIPVALNGLDKANPYRIF